MDKQVDKEAPITSPSLERLVKYLPLITISHLVIGLPALVGSLALAYFAFVQADATRKMQTGGAMPFITIGTSNANPQGEEEISLNLANNGVGPAIMGPIEIRYAGKAAATPRDLLENCCGLVRQANMSFMSSPASDIAIRPGEEVAFLRLAKNANNGPVWQKLNEERWKFQIRSCYFSIFGDCWISEGMQGRPRQAAQCPADWTPYRENVPTARSSGP